MATRKIRLTMSGTQVDGQGPIVDIDFNGVNLDTDIDVNSIHGESTITKEYTVDVDAGSFDLNIEYKNDVGDNGDRNFYIDTIEVANDGTNYEPWFITPSNSNMDDNVNTPFPWAGYHAQLDGAGNRIPNPDYDNTQPHTDNDAWSSRPAGFHPSPGNNARYLYDNAKTGPFAIYENKVVTLNITFS